MSSSRFPVRLDRLARGGMLLGALLGAARDAEAQEDGPRVRYIISIGDYPRVDGLRLNYRDSELDLVRGANVTLWTPYEGDWSGTVRGLALGLPSTGAARIQGLGIGVFGLAASEELSGLALGGIGVGSGGRLRGISVGGIGVGAGDDVSGIALGGIGVGGGGSVRGIAAGGIGVGAGGDIHGIALGGIGAGTGGSATGLLVGGIGAAAGGNATGVLIGGVGAAAGGDLKWLAVGGIGVGAGGDATGLFIGGIGAGVGGDMTGIGIGGVGVGAGGTLHGLFVGGVGVGAPRIVGMAVGSAVGAEEVEGFVLAPVFFRTEIGGEIGGASLSAVNIVRGGVRGFTVGLVNYAWSVDGFQLGVINIIRDNPRNRRVLPLVNW